MSGKGVVRSIKNYAKGFSDIQIKVREATSNDTWGPSGSLMNEIAQLTFNEQDFIEIMDMLDRRLNDKGKNWRHVFKALLLLDYCLHVGSENVVLYAKENIYVVRTLKEFQHIDETGKDVGFNVRQKAKDITSLLLDEQRLKEERRSRNRMQERMANVGDIMNDVMSGGRSGNGEEQEVYRNPGYLDEDKDLKKAIEESKRMAEQEFRNRGEGTDADLQKAIEESEREARESERKKREALEKQNQENLFGNQQAFQPFPANQSFNSSVNPYGQQQQQVQQQWPQSTGLTGMSFAEPIQQQFNNPYQQQGFNNFNLQAQMTGMPIQNQMTGMPSLQAQMTGMPLQNQMTGMPQQQLQTQFTGASNPFGQQLSTPQSNNSNSMFGTQFTGMQQQSPAALEASTPKKDENPHHSKLNSMLANRDDGMDTFGNTGNLRIPYGTGYASSLVPQSSISNDLLSINTSNVDSPLGNTSPGAFSQPFGQAPNRNPFGQPNTPTSSISTPKQQQKSLLEMMQEQKLQQHQQQQLQAQMTGYQQPQMTGQQQGYNNNNNTNLFNQPQMTGYNNNQSFGTPQQQQQQPFGNQPFGSQGQQQQQPFGNQGQQQQSFF